MQRSSMTSSTSRPAAKQADENTSPIPAPMPLNLDLKEARTWDHDQLRLMKDADVSKSKRKQRWYDWRPPRHVVVGENLDAASSRPVYTNRRRKPLRYDWRRAEDIESETLRPISGHGNSKQGDDALELSRPQSLPSLQREVPLADLLVSRKPRRGQEPDFEMVPRLRSVIMLDDAAAPDLVVEDPWVRLGAGDVDAIDVSPKKLEPGVDVEIRPSYAMVAAPY